MPPTRTILLLALAACLAGCVHSYRADPNATGPIDNLHQLTPRLYSGAQPEGDAAFAHLASLGVKTILTVDGARPDVDAAAKHGIRYVHLPIGYDGIDPEQQKRIVAAAREYSSPGAPMFIHCHHGKHRGPTAAAICAVTLDGWTNEQAVQWMRETGKTSPDYAGLYATARDFTKPTPAELDAAAKEPFPSTAQTGDMVDAMVAIDTHFEHLKAIKAAGWKTPADQPDLVPPRESQLLQDHFDHLLRSNPDADPKLRASLEQSIILTKEAGRYLSYAMRDNKVSPEIKEPLERIFDALQQECKRCHKAFRN